MPDKPTGCIQCGADLTAEGCLRCRLSLPAASGFVQPNQPAQQDPKAAEILQLRAELETERVTLRALQARMTRAVEAAAVGEWVVRALRGQPNSDFAESYPEVVEAADMRERLERAEAACAAWERIVIWIAEDSHRWTALHRALHPDLREPRAVSCASDQAVDARGMFQYLLAQVDGEAGGERDG